MATPLGPNMKKLIIRFLSLEAVPQGGNFADGMNFLSNPAGVRQAWNRSVEKAKLAVDAIRAAPDNPYGDDEEVIAGVILDRVSERESVKNGVLSQETRGD